MSEITTVGKFAEDIGTSIEKLQKQLVEAGLPKKECDDVINNSEKSKLLSFLRKQHGKDENSEPRKVILRRKTMSEIQVPVSSQGRMKPRSKTINVEVRGRRIYAKRSAVIEETLKREEERRRKEQAIAEMQALEKEANAVASEKATAKPSVTAVEAPVRESAIQEGENQTDADMPPVEAEKVDPVAEVEADAAVEPTGTESPKSPDGNKKNGQQPSRGREELHVATKISGRRRKKARPALAVRHSGVQQHGFEKPTAPIVKEIDIPESITVSELAQRMSIKSSEVIKIMMGLGSMVTINQMIDQDTASIVVEEMGHIPRLLKENALEEEIIRSAQQDGEAFRRAPIVTIMGHVDHGKTSLLDYIRRSKVAGSEAGGITQHIGAYRVETDGGEITFLDTPGHEAFTAMRARGAKVTDIVVVVVAADDGVMPQTIEAITHARAGNAPIIIAINKIDKEDADPERIKQALAKQEVISEDWGGDTQFVNVSALTGQGVNDLLESIILQSEILELKAVATGPASGVVIESRLDKSRGPIASVLIQQGTLNKGEVLLSGHEFGRVRVMINDKGDEVDSAGPSTPVEVLGLSGTSNVGDEVIVVPNEKKARELALFRQGKYRETRMAQQTPKFEDVVDQMMGGETVSLNLLIKSDVQGSAEALTNALTRLGNDEVKVNVISSGVGGITESDINLAMTSNAIVIGFNVRTDASAGRLADAESIDLRYYSIIYDVIDDIEAAAEGLLAPKHRENIIGVAEVREVFHSPKFGDIAGCMVINGYIRRSNPIRVLRDNIVIYEGELESLRRFKDDVNEVKSGMDCGIGVKNYSNVRAGDQIEVFERIKSKT